MTEDKSPRDESSVVNKDKHCSLVSDILIYSDNRKSIIKEYLSVSTNLKLPI